MLTVASTVEPLVAALEKWSSKPSRVTSPTTSVAGPADDRVDPELVPSALHRDGHRRRGSCVQAFHSVLIMRELVLLELARLGIQDCHLLLAGMQVVSDGADVIAWTKELMAVE